MLSDASETKTPNGPLCKSRSFYLVGFHWIIHFELLPANAKANSHIYCQQLERLDVSLKKKIALALMLDRDNARFNTANNA